MAKAIKRQKNSIEDYKQAVADGVCILLGYAADITTPQYHYIRAAHRNGIPADDHALRLAAEIERQDARQRAF